MKYIKPVTLIIFFIFIKYAASNIVTVQVANFSFNPQTVNITVNDTVQWAWSSGSHTTTSVTIPAGAPAWDVPMNSTSTTFSYVVTVAGTYNYQCNIHATMGMTGTITVNPIGIKPISTSVPDKFNLYQNYPNPFNPSTNFKFDLPEKSDVKFIVYDVSGRTVANLVNEKLRAGTYSVDWNASNISSGVYFYRLETQQYNFTKKLVLIK